MVLQHHSAVIASVSGWSRRETNPNENRTRRGRHLEFLAGLQPAVINVSYPILSFVFLHRVSKRKLGARTEIWGVLFLWDEAVELGY